MATTTTVTISSPPFLPNNHRDSAMNSVSLFSRRAPNLSPPQIFSLFLTSHRLRLFSSSLSTTLDDPVPSRTRRFRVRVAAKTDSETQQKLKDNWLASLSSSTPPPQQLGFAGEDGPLEFHASSSPWVIGIDPDIHGAVALLKGSHSDCCSAQVFDSPHLPVLIGGRIRKRLDTKSIVELLRSFDAPNGTTAYVEQSMPFPKDGKQSWWGGGFGYGLWIGMLVALGFSVVPVTSGTWKRNFELSGPSFTKDDSRRVASTLFPPLSSLLKRKKDHGRAEALLIAAYGRGMKIEMEETIDLDKLNS